MRGFPLQDEGPGMNELFHDLQIEQEERRAKLRESCQHTNLRRWPSGLEECKDCGQRMP